MKPFAFFLCSYELGGCEPIAQEVTGSKITYKGADVLLARTVKKANKTLILRNAEGIPQWATGRRRY